MEHQVDESTEPAFTMQPAKAKKPAKATRISAACTRCQRRKIRCDGSLPSCKPCQRAGTTCMGSSKQRDRETSRESRIHISKLKSRIAWLEDAVHSRYPDIDLSDAPSIADVAEHAEPSHVASESLQTPTAVDRDAQGSNRQGISDLTSPSTPLGNLDHELRLVSSSAGADHRYIGASSGYSFARLLLNTVGEQSPINNIVSSNAGDGVQQATSPFLQSALEIGPSPLPQSYEQAMQLSSAYFNTVHLQFPLLHQPTHEMNIKRMYVQDDDSDHIIPFQVYMVLAISSTILSRRHKVALSAEGFCISALKHIEHIDLTTSLRGLQCTMLLLVYALNSPSVGLNMWYLHHQCVAALIDLGLQCQVPSGRYNLIEGQLRRRAFICVYTMDQNLSTIMGRPAVLRDEDCSCQAPEDVADDNLSEARLISREPRDPPTNISNAIHLFELARMNSEIKYFLRPSSSKSFSTYTRSPNINLVEWQQGMLSRLRQWAASIPTQDMDGAYITELSEIKYHNVVMLLLRPSPAIRQPSEASLELCYESAVQNLRIYNRLYKNGVLAYSWVTVHSIFLSSLTMMYCVWVMPEIARKIRLDVFVSDLKAGSDVLSATGEHWPQAKRCRDALENLSNSTICLLSEIKQRQPQHHRGPAQYRTDQRNRGAERASLDMQGLLPSNSFAAHGEGEQPNENTAPDFISMLDSSNFPEFDAISSFFGSSGDMQGTYDINWMIDEIFNDFQPPLDLQ